MATANRSVVVKVVNAPEVEALTKEGWQLDDVLQESVVEPFNESVPFLPTGQTYTVNGSGTRGFLVTKNLFLLKKDGSTVMAEVYELLKQADQAKHDLANRLVEAEKKTAEAVKEVANVKRQVANSVAHGSSLAEQLTTAKKTNQKMENDIAKIRQAVGELKMKEILR
jgi:septal ring factor EnvC (AmiA/AmiB activator)